MSQFTLERLQEIFGGKITESYNRIHCHLEVAGQSLAAQIILDPAAPDGIRVHSNPKAKGRCTALVRERLGLPPAPLSDNDDSIDGDTLLRTDFPPLKYVVPRYIVEGLTVLGGKPKLGKSWLALDVAIAVATGGKAMGHVDCEPGDVLFLALEDNRRRMKERIKIVRPNGGSLARLRIKTDAPRIDDGLLDQLEAWRAGVLNPRLIVIDVYMKVRPQRRKNEDAYGADYAAILPVQKYALQHGLAVVLITHTRKMEAEDPLEAISGTNGITGAADAVLVLARTPKGPTLYGRGRDIEEIETALKFDGGRWTVLGDADNVHYSDDRRKIVARLKEADGPLGPNQIAGATGIGPQNVRTLLWRMAKAGEVEKTGRGRYRLCTSETSVTMPLAIAA